MPGISLLRGDIADGSVSTDEVLDSLRFLDDYEVNREVTTGGVEIAHTGYPAYPVERVDTDDAVVLCEGRLYDVDDTAAHLRRVADWVRAGEHRRLSSWLGDRDGDFLIVVYERGSERITVLNDTFCRLPTYYARVGDSLVLSRELQFVRDVARRAGDPLELDQFGAAQQFLFGYTLGDRTVFDGVRSVPPAARFHVDDDGVTVDRLYRHRFDRKAHADRSVEENAARLVDRFLTACENRVTEGSSDVVSLSGGLDSRAVLGAYDFLDVPCDAATFDTPDGTYEDDARVARETAARLDVDWNQYVSEATRANHERMLAMKQGMNYLGMTFILDFFEQLRDEYGSLTYHTGDGGDKVLVDLRPPRSFGSTEHLTDYVIDANGRVPLEDAAAVADVDPEELRATVTERLRSYPETDHRQKYAHFLVRERGYNFLNQGEDRNRYYFWSATPFYSLPVFEYAMNCPDEQKQQRALYTAFLERFSPELLELEYPNFGAPITSLEYRVKRRVYDELSRFPRLQETVVDLVASGNADTSDVARRIQAQLAESDLAPMADDAIADVVRDHHSYDQIPLHYLFTLTSLVVDMHETDQRAVADAERTAAQSVPNQ